MRIAQMWYVVAFIGIVASKVWSLNDTLARTPPMGWNSWNLFGSNPSEAKVKAVADAFVTDGLKDAGYQYIVVDDCWSNANRDATGTLVTQSAKFPNGMKPVADYVHGKGLKFGMYACPTTCTCCGEAGSYNHETKDAQTFTSWGVDYLKYDWCGVQSGEDKLSLTPADIIKRYVTMREALKATKRSVIFALCEKGQKSKVVPGTWSDTVGHMWRIGGDISANWASIIKHIDANAQLAAYAGSTQGWNDPDMLEVGNGSLTEDENRAHFSMWCIMASPLILGNDPSKMSAAITKIVTNKEVIAINQDSLGVQGIRIKQTGNQEVWVKPLMNGDKAVALFNRDAAAAKITVNFSDSLITWNSGAKVKVRDLWKAKDSLDVSTSYSAQVPSHAVVMLRLNNSATDVNSFGSDIASIDLMSKIRIERTSTEIRFFMPLGDSHGVAEILDLQGKKLKSLIARTGWNTVPQNVLSSGINIIRVKSGTQIRTLVVAQNR